MDPVIPLADLQPIYSVADVGRALEDGAAKRREAHVEREHELAAAAARAPFDLGDGRFRHGEDL